MQHDTLPPISPAPMAPRRARTLLLLSCAAALLAATLSGRAAAQQPPAPPACTTPSVQAAGSSICGVLDTVAVAGQQTTVPVYRGIPYAQAPVGRNRWRAPQDTTLGPTLQATAFGKTCPQSIAPDTLHTFGDAPGATVVVDTMGSNQSENCLFLNIWKPSASATGRPVMVFIHGGAFVLGSGSSPIYNGAYLAASGNVVVVTLNYRLGALGFLYAGTTVPGDTINGNFGLLDQQKALQWVRSNISAFGGDPNQVTIFGESAGAMSVSFHLFGMPSSTGLFRAAIMESNPMGVQYRAPAEALTDASSFLDILCSIAAPPNACPRNAAWLQSVSVDSIMMAQTQYETGPLGLLGRLKAGGLAEGLPWTPVVDGSLVVGQPYNGFAPSMPTKPYIFGVNQDEGVIFAALAEAKLELGLTALYGTLLGDVFGSSNADVITSYPQGLALHKPYRALGHTLTRPLGPTASALAELITHFAFDCGNLVSADSATAQIARAPADSAQPAVYGYLFTQRPFFNLYGTLKSEPCTNQTGYVCHAYELPYVFNTFAQARAADPADATTPTTADTLVAQAMASAWTRFATNPGQPPATGWTPYSTSSGALYVWSGSQDGKSNTSHMQTPSEPRLSTTANCSLWRTMPPYTARR